MKIKNPFLSLTRFEFFLWVTSFVTVLLSFLLSPARDIPTLIASLIGVTSLIFIAKGMVFGHFLIIFFSLLYGYVSFKFSYYGEMITYIFLSTPAAIASIISWIRNPYGESSEVRVNKALGKKELLFITLLTVTATSLSYFLLEHFGTASLTFSTLSVATSFFAATLTYLRSPFYALAYSANDVVLIVLWALAAIEDVSYLPMIFCFIMFLINDLYGFVNWRRMEKRQK